MERILGDADVGVGAEYLDLTQSQVLLPITHVAGQIIAVSLLARKAHKDITSLDATRPAVNIDPLITPKVTVRPELGTTALRLDDGSFNSILVRNQDLKIIKTTLAVIATTIRASKNANKTNWRWIHKINTEPRVATGFRRS